MVAKRLAKKEKNHQDMHVNTYSDKIVNHSKSTALERSVKTLLGVLNRFYVPITLALSSDVVYTRCVQSVWSASNASVQHLQEHKNQTNTEMKQWWGSTARNDWNAETNENQQLYSGGPDQSIRHQPTYLKVFRPELS